jgi:ribosome-binding ATPase YchF (GTP1/OBG family)
LADVLIASYPFATIKPNTGVGYVRVEALCNEFNTKCNPRTGFCDGNTRFVPVELMDVAGLVEGASEGKGLGNQFLNDLSRADAFIHVVDISGTTDSEGKEGEGNPIQDVKMLENELDKWYLSILSRVWKSFARTIQMEKQDFAKAVAKQFSGLNVDEDNVKSVLLKLKYDSEKPDSWSDEQLFNFAHALRHETKPMIVAANKVDKKGAKENLELLKNEFPDLLIVPCSADAELSLRQASKADLIEYVPGNKEFKINEGKVNEKQKEALVKIKKDVLDVFGCTGIQDVLDKSVFELLNYIAVFPASANKLGDSKGNILPDCFLVPKGSTALDFAYIIHSDLGDDFIRAVDARTKQIIGKEYELKHRDGIEIIT